MLTRPKTETEKLIEIVMGCQSISHQMHRFKSGDPDIIRSRQLLQLFAGRAVITAAEVPEAFEAATESGFSLEFEAQRGGEVIRWGVDNGVITRTAVDQQPAWQITDAEREPLFVMIGSSRRTERKIRTRRWTSPEDEKACRVALNRRAAARERHRVNAVAMSRRNVERQLASILGRDIEVEARGALQQYTAPGAMKLVEIQAYVLQLLDDMSVADAATVERCLLFEYEDITALPLPQSVTAESDDDVDLDILGDF